MHVLLLKTFHLDTIFLSLYKKACYQTGLHLMCGSEMDKTDHWWVSWTTRSWNWKRSIIPVDGEILKFGLLFFILLEFIWAEELSFQNWCSPCCDQFDWILCATSPHHLRLAFLVERILLSPACIHADWQIFHVDSDGHGGVVHLWTEKGVVLTRAVEQDFRVGFLHCKFEVALVANKTKLTS